MINQIGIHYVKEENMKTTARIMVVDDEKQICQNVEKILSKGDYEVSYATSAKEALDKMAKEAFSLLISDVIMPGMNGLELLKLVKDQWPLTKVVMITAYATTDTAVKAVKLGALDYIPKPFTPDELRATVERALEGKLVEASVTEKEREAIDVIDVDVPFDRDEVAKYAGEDYAEMVGPSDMPMPAMEFFCEVGARVCLDVFKKLGHTCKKGLKTGKCPQEEKKVAAKGKAFDAKTLIGIDYPFNYEEVVSITGPEYVRNLHSDGISFVPYDELKSYEELRQEVARRVEKEEEKVIPIREEVMREPDAKSILVIDDEVGITNNIRKILSNEGYHVDQAITKDEAYQRIEDRAYNLVLLDLKISGVKGLELLKAVRDKGPNTPVIIITGYGSIETAVESAKMGIVDYLNKPFTPDQIRDATERAFHLAA
jgi:DNA-binding response OmpR family regulator